MLNEIMLQTAQHYPEIGSNILIPSTSNVIFGTGLVDFISKSMYFNTQDSYIYY